MVKKYYAAAAYKYIPIRGKNMRIENNDFFEIWKVVTPTELKLVYISKKIEKNKFLIIESIATDPLQKNNMIIEFNSALNMEKINFMNVIDTNQY